MATDDYEHIGPVRRAVRQAVTSRPVAALSGAVLPRLDTVVLRRTRGRATLSGWLTGLPIVLLGTTGARSGEPRSTPVMAIPVQDGYLVAAANFGSTQHPAWYYNVRATPAVTVTRGTATREFRAAELHGDERDRAFERALRLNPGWTRFRARAGGRVIPVFRLVPAAGR